LARWYTDKRGRHRPITPRGRWQYYVRPTPPKRSSFTYQRFPEPLPENIIRPRFTISEHTREQICNDVLNYVAEKVGDEAARTIASSLPHLIPSTLGVNVRQVIKIEQRRNAVKGYVGISVPISLSTLPAGGVVQLVAGTPTIFANIQCQVRLYKRKKVVQTTEIRVGYSQKPAWTEQDVSVEWHKSFKPVELTLSRQS
jgi:hypothetical protein